MQCSFQLGVTAGESTLTMQIEQCWSALCTVMNGMHVLMHASYSCGWVVCPGAGALPTAGHHATSAWSAPGLHPRGCIDGRR